MPRPRPIEKIHAAAWYFAHISRYIEEIADVFKVSTDTIRKWEKTPEWDDALYAFKYEGDRSFASSPKRDTVRERGAELETARTLYLKLLDADEPPHRIPRLVSEQTGIPQRNIYEWAKRYNWGREQADA